MKNRKGVLEAADNDRLLSRPRLLKCRLFRHIRAQPRRIEFALRFRWRPIETIDSMFSYRHAFHAGNHADVLKHTVLIQILHYLNQKDTPYMVIDTHAGAGVYALDSEYASKNAEYETGIARLWERKDLPEAMADYVGLVKAMNPNGKLRYYPGSPYCAEKTMREQDRLRLFEMHPTEGKILDDNIRKLEAHAAAQGQPAGRGKRILAQRSDGFLGLKALLPPPSRRGLILIDPPYEDKNDYRKVKEALGDALSRFATGTYAVWYPVLNRNESRLLPEKLKQLPCKEWLDVTLSISGPVPDGFGLRSSGMFVLNPPWTLEKTLRGVMPYLVDALGADPAAGFTLECGVPSEPASKSRRG
jgi:23S rRNA (adenine2030-N6)-methyltransferase